MAATIQLHRGWIQPLPPSTSTNPLKSLASSFAHLPLTLSHRSTTLRSASYCSRRHHRKGFRLPATTAAASYSLFTVAALGKLSETAPVAVRSGSEGIEARFPSGSGVYAIYDAGGDLQFVGISRNIAASVAAHSKMVPDLCSSVKVGLVEGPTPDRQVLTSAWKSWMEEHIAAAGKVPPGNETGNETWVRRQRKKADLRLTPGRQTQLAVPLEDLIGRLVRENKVVAFIKGSRSAPQCGFSQRVVGILESHGIDFESVDVLDEEHNPGLRETLKGYSKWPTFPQIFVGGELVGGCDILSSMEEKGELAELFRE